MPVYMVDRDLPGIQMEQLAAAQKAAIDLSQQMTAQGKNVRYIRSAFQHQPRVASATPDAAPCSGMGHSRASCQGEDD